LISGDEKVKTSRQIRWQTVANQNYTYKRHTQYRRTEYQCHLPFAGRSLCHYVPPPFLHRRSPRHLKQGTSSRYGSVDDVTTTYGLSYLALQVCLPLTISLDDGDTDYEMEEATAPPISGRYRNFELHTHVPIKHLLYHLGPAAFVGDNRANLTLTAIKAGLWLSLTQKATSEALKKLRIKIPGGQMEKK